MSRTMFSIHRILCRLNSGANRTRSPARPQLRRLALRTQVRRTRRANSARGVEARQNRSSDRLGSDVLVWLGASAGVTPVRHHHDDLTHSHGCGNSYATSSPMPTYTDAPDKHSKQPRRVTLVALQLTRRRDSCGAGPSDQDTSRPLNTGRLPAASCHGPLSHAYPSVV